MDDQNTPDTTIGSMMVLPSNTSTAWNNEVVSRKSIEMVGKACSAWMCTPKPFVSIRVLIQVPPPMMKPWLEFNTRSARSRSKFFVLVLVLVNMKLVVCIMLLLLFDNVVIENGTCLYTNCTGHFLFASLKALKGRTLQVDVIAFKQEVKVMLRVMIVVSC